MNKMIYNMYNLHIYNYTCDRDLFDQMAHISKLFTKLKNFQQNNSQIKYG